LVRSSLVRACLGAGGILAGALLLAGAGINVSQGTQGPDTAADGSAAMNIVLPPVVANSQAGAPLAPPADQAEADTSLPAAPGAIDERDPVTTPAGVLEGMEDVSPDAELSSDGSLAPGAASPPEVRDSAAVAAPAAQPATVPQSAPVPPDYVAVVSEPPPAVDGSAFAVVDRACGDVIWGHNHDERLPPASLTKIVTALAVVDMVSLDAMAEAHVSGAKMKERGSSVMGVEPGMQLSVLDLLNGLMLKSGNDAALVLAEHAGAGNTDAFITAMNVKAQAVGMTNSQFANPHGLDQDGHYSSALDMAKAGAALLENPVLSQISATPEYWPHWDGDSMRNGNKLLRRYPGAYGVKIGYTEAASQTIVAAAERGGRHVIVSVFGSDDRYTDATLLLDWAFAKTASGCPQ
jgi:D-alanyl-D-alanine carboxypeptidase